MVVLSVKQGYLDVGRLSTMWGVCVEGAEWLSAGCLEDGCRVWGGSLEGMGRLSVEYVKAVWRLWGG